MPTTFEQSYSLPQPFARVATAVPRKYPNPEAAHVVSVDTIDISFDDAGRLRWERILGVEQSTPAIVLKVRCVEATL